MLIQILVYMSKTGHNSPAFQMVQVVPQYLHPLGFPAVLELLLHPWVQPPPKTTWNKGEVKRPLQIRGPERKPSKNQAHL